jgi:tRNA(fMet)-specific endonuclease VapC
MALSYLLDTNVLSDFVRGHSSVQRRLIETPPEQLAFSSMTVMEVSYGLALAPERARRIRPMIESMLKVVELLPLTVEDARAAGTIRAALRRRGAPIGPYDVLLAGCAMTRGLTLVTANVRELGRVAGLAVEDWRV